ncbi:ROK family protein [Niastella caeni]|uniref:ROK family protein n=1 Tax=Niastella caeni TaxID=2569763 RepID=A0A4S8HWQ6_9BACT|nr:ROK family protein [Niastella caeni]THU39681.1 ROK family protein [Niastella caeni]
MDKRTASMSLALGIDIGGSHITAGVVDLAQKKIIEDSVVRQLVNRHAPAEEILGIWADTIKGRLLYCEHQATTIGFAMPGPFDYPNGICLIKGFDKYEALYGMNIRKELSARTGMPAEQISFRNDADAFLEGELFGGAGQGFTRALGLTLGTGLGSCLYVDGEITNAGLNVLPFKGGIAEEYLSTRWFVKTFHKLTGRQVNGVKELAEMYCDNDMARLVFDEFSVSFGEVLQHCLRSFDVEVIIIGGNISNAYSLFIDQVLKHLPAENKRPLIKQATLGEQAAMMGAAIHHRYYRMV